MNVIGGPFEGMQGLCTFRKKKYDDDSTMYHYYLVKLAIIILVRPSILTIMSLCVHFPFHSLEKEKEKKDKLDAAATYYYIY